MNIKASILIFFSLLFVAMSAEGSRAFRYTKKVMQRDGTLLTLVRMGDEYMSYWATTDGVAVKAVADGEWRYARFNAKGLLLPTDRLAHEAELRSFVERSEVKLLQEEFESRLNRTAPLLRYGIGSRAEASVYSIGQPRIPIILVQYADLPMMEANTADKFRRHFNGVNYKEEGGAGSVRDYFISQSDSLFRPMFDIIGPVTLSKRAAAYGLNSSNGNDANDAAMVREAIDAAQVAGTDFSVYATDGNVPFVGVIFAGFGEQACDEDAIKGTVYEKVGVDSTIWAKYRSNLNYKSGDLSFRAALCTNEVANYDRKGPKIDGIGTFCHEFSHALGLPDFYGPTGVFGMDYWDIMDYGQFVVNGTSPIGYTAYEREFMGWIKINTLNMDQKQKVTLAPLGGTGANRAYKIVNPQNANEYYILENRQPSTWFHKVFGHGMLVSHVDYSSSDWGSNRVNMSARHQRMTIIPADNVLTPAADVASFNSYKGDLFPGLAGNTSLTSVTTPNDTVYAGGHMGVKLNDISEDTLGNVIFAFMADGILNPPAALAVAVTGEEADSATMTATWEPTDKATAYVVNLKEADGTTIEADTVATNAYTFRVKCGTGDYNLTVAAIADTYIGSEPAAVQFSALPSGITEVRTLQGPFDAYSVNGMWIGRFADRREFLSKVARFAPGVYLLKQKGRIIKIVSGQ